MGIGSFFSQLFRSSKNRQENFASFRSSFNAKNPSTQGAGGYRHLIKWDEEGEHQQSLNRSSGKESDRFKAVRDAYNACGKSEAGDEKTVPLETESVDLSSASNKQLNDLILACGHDLFDRSGHRWTFQGQKRKDWVSFVDRIARQQRYSNHVTDCEKEIGVESFLTSFGGNTIWQKINERKEQGPKQSRQGSKGKKSTAKGKTTAKPNEEKSPEQTLLEQIKNQALFASIGLNSAPWAKKYQDVADNVVAEVDKLLGGKVAYSGGYESTKFVQLATALKNFRTTANGSGWTTENLDKYSKIDPTDIDTSQSYDTYIQNPNNHGNGSDKGRGSGIAGMTGGGGGGGVGGYLPKLHTPKDVERYLRGEY